MDEPLKALQELGSEFERLARHQMPRRRWPWRSSLLAVVGVSTLSAAALAASGVLTGSAVTDPPGSKPTADAGAGLPRTAGAQLTALRVADPGGGPAWGLRTLTTTRALGCVQLGRVVDGRLGVLGQDSAFADDGRFHRLAAEVQSGRQCQPLDGAGHLFLAVSYQGLPASAMAGACLARRPPPPPAGAPAPNRQSPLCPKRDLRIVFYGALGPQARSVSYRDNTGRTVTARTAGPNGAYLVVLRPSARRPAKGYYVPSTSPVSGLTRITYRDGRVCRLRDPRSVGGGKPCPRVGFVAPRRPSVSAEQVRTRVQARFDPRPVHPAGPGEPAPAAAEWALRVSFTARKAAGPRSAYLLEIRIDDPGRCGNTSAFGGAISRNVRAGERVTEVNYVPAGCRSTLRGSISYRADAASGPEPPGRSRSTVPVGNFRATVPIKP